MKINSEKDIIKQHNSKRKPVNSRNNNKKEIAA